MPSKNPESAADVEAARQHARRLLVRYAIERPADIDLEAIAMAEGVLVMEGPLVGAEARLVRGRHCGLVRVRRGIPEEGRRRLTVAHELGHWIMHREHSQLPLLLCEIRDSETTDSGTTGYASSPLEIEATAFASELLLPAALFEPMLAQLGDTPTLEHLKSLALTFNTTLTATAVRLVQARPDCFLAFTSLMQGVTWWKRCESKRTPVFLWLKKRQAVDRRSMAWRCLHNTDETEREEVPLDAWFGHLTFKRPVRLYEQAMRLGTYDTVMSLLTVVKDDGAQPDALPPRRTEGRDKNISHGTHRTSALDLDDPS